MKKTPLSYYGGKQKLVATIKTKLHDHNLYCEPFIGGAAVLFGKDPSEIEVINDTNKELMNFYRVAKEKFIDLQAMVRITLHSRKAHQDANVIYANPHFVHRCATCLGRVGVELAIIQCVARWIVGI
jgi:DNA adenine methylase